MRAVRLTVRGAVQGVFYRVGAREEAERLGIAGSCVNAEDGTVRIDAEGEDAAVAAFIEWCAEGSSLARVDGMDIEEGRPSGARGFVIG